MTFSVDLISDLHIETWQSFDWTGQATSPYCIVAGDIAKDQEIVCETLEHLGHCYSAVFYIDGNDEHKYNMEDIGSSYKLLNQNVRGITNVVYMQDNVVIINGVAILATNGWWTFDLDPALDYDQSTVWLQHKSNYSQSTTDSIAGIAFNDAAYMINSIRKLQTHRDVRSIICVTHTVPAPWLVNHDMDLVDTWRFNCMGNPHMQKVLAEDTERKIHTWCFGHYHMPVDRYNDGIRYVNNCRGRGDTEYKQSVYFPKRIVVDF